MSPGVYIIDRGTFDIGGGTEVTGTGVTIFLTRSKGSDFAEAVIGNGAKSNSPRPRAAPRPVLSFSATATPP